jgi:polyisoprenyl-phosphate glycosyltransferase
MNPASWAPSHNRQPISRPPASTPALLPDPAAVPALAPVPAPDSVAAPRLALVVPCFNEEEVLPETMRQLGAVLADLMARGLVAGDSFALYVDDGSHDATWDLIAAAQRQSDAVAGVKLARNAGHQKALLAGIQAALPAADCVISIDADLQDDVTAIPRLVERFRAGFDIVYGVRRQRSTDSWFKRTTARDFYRVMRALGVQIVDDHADYRLMSKRALEQLERFGEVNIFLRGVVPLLGFPATEVYYDRQVRAAGESKYPLRKMLAFAADGITSFSLAPLRYVGGLGLILCLASILGAIAAVVCWAVGMAVPGWTAILISLWFLAGLGLGALGLVGEYVGKAYQETKRRPRFIVETVLEPRDGIFVSAPRLASRQDAVR